MQENILSVVSSLKLIVAYSDVSASHTRGMAVPRGDQLTSRINPREAVLTYKIVVLARFKHRIVAGTVSLKNCRIIFQCEGHVTQDEFPVTRLIHLAALIVTSADQPQIFVMWIQTTSIVKSCYYGSSVRAYEDQFWHWEDALCSVSHESAKKKSYQWIFLKPSLAPVPSRATTDSDVCSCTAST